MQVVGVRLSRQRIMSIPVALNTMLPNMNTNQAQQRSFTARPVRMLILPVIPIISLIPYFNHKLDGSRLVVHRGVFTAAHHLFGSIAAHV
jgi:hypothetical protein